MRGCAWVTEHVDRDPQTHSANHSQQKIVLHPNCNPWGLRRGISNAELVSISSSSSGAAISVGRTASQRQWIHHHSCKQQSTLWTLFFCLIICEDALSTPPRETMTPCQHDTVILWLSQSSVLISNSNVWLSSKPRTKKKFATQPDIRKVIFSNLPVDCANHRRGQLGTGGVVVVGQRL